MEWTQAHKTEATKWQVAVYLNDGVKIKDGGVRALRVGSWLVGFKVVCPAGLGSWKV